MGVQEQVTHALDDQIALGVWSEDQLQTSTLV